ncbi:hypothetical protein BZG36_05587 [Bifiguratus adelaidae]|uniref:Enoyl reductase (ER) domain-containing protein n=1 Tax=Bifiguratus adelaidae TaxID=1938954 RepID=A0A261XSX9_9FUNG|nr:hypothetical protein BZG36_05587 [Bifiguratus adelaidae]
MVKNTKVVYKKLPPALPAVGEHIALETSELDIDNVKLDDGDILIKSLVLSADPFLRARMREPSIKSYAPAYEIGQTMDGYGVAVVVKSAHSVFKEGHYVYGGIPFAEYSHIPKSYVSSLLLRDEAKRDQLPLTYYVGILGMPGMTAYVGFYKYAKPKKGDTIWVSAASGAVGQVVGQLAKAEGLFVIGSVGDDQKGEYLLKNGFDAVFNYKTSDMDEQLTKLAPNGIDIYYENVGGKHLDAAIAHAKNHARFAMCGMISQYNLENPEPVYNLSWIPAKRIQMDGFVVLDHEETIADEFTTKMTKMIKDGKIHFKEHVAIGIEKLPETLVGLFSSATFGKAVVQVAEQ